MNKLEVDLSKLSYQKLISLCESYNLGQNVIFDVAIKALWEIHHDPNKRKVISQFLVTRTQGLAQASLPARKGAQRRRCQ